MEILTAATNDCKSTPQQKKRDRALLARYGKSLAAAQKQKEVAQEKMKDETLGKMKVSDNEEQCDNEEKSDYSSHERRSQRASLRSSLPTFALLLAPYPYTLTTTLALAGPRKLVPQQFWSQS